MDTFRRYCQFTEDLCPRQLPQQNGRCLFFAYPSKPKISAEAIHKSNCVVLNTTDINFNIMFEYGYAIGTGRAIWPLIEEGIEKGARVYDTIKTLTTVGYSGFANSRTIYTRIKRKTPWKRQPKFPLPERLGKDPTREGVGLLYLQSLDGHNL